MRRTVLITGCSDGGLGAALAVEFHRNNCQVFATARNTSKMKALEAQGITTLTLDVLSDESVKSCVEKVAALTGGSLDVLINNAGAGYNMPLIDADISETSKLFELNVYSLLRTTKHFFPLLQNSKEGAIIANNTSLVSVISVPCQGPYGASKAAAASMTETLRLELQPFGIKVIDLKTASVKSQFFDNLSLRVAPKLPDDSPYSPAKDVIEPFMAGDMNTSFMESNVWAERVVGDLLKQNPPHQIWRGNSASLIRYSTHLPVGAMDGKLKSVANFDVAERKILQHRRMSATA